jgi:uncharacterized membrane protein
MSNTFPPEPDANEPEPWTSTGYSDSQSAPDEGQLAPEVEQPSTPAPLTGRTVVLDLDYNVAAGLAYASPLFFVGVLASAVFWRTEPVNNYDLRFQAMQSLMLTGAFVVLSLGCSIGMLVFAIIPFVQKIMVPIFNLSYIMLLGAWIVVSILMMMKAYKGEIYKIPIIGDYAAAQANVGV